MGNVLTMTDEEIENRLKEMYGEGVTEKQIAATKTLLRDKVLKNMFSKFQDEIKQDEESEIKPDEIIPKMLNKIEQDEIKQNEMLQKMLDKYSSEELHEHAVDIMNSFSPDAIVAAEHLFKSP